MDPHVDRDLSINNINYDRDPLLFFPYVSLPFVLRYPGQTPLQTLQNLLEDLKATGYYDDANSRWEMPLMSSQKSSAEQQMALFFNKILLQVYRGRALNALWRCHSTTLVEGIRKPDLILVPYGKVEIGQITFRDVYSYCEMKQSFSRGLKAQALWQMVEIAGYAIAAQVNRRFYVAMSLCGRMLTLSFMIRGTIVFSRPLNIDSQPLTFLTVLLGLSSADPTWNGFHDKMIALGRTYVLFDHPSFKDIETSWPPSDKQKSSKEVSRDTTDIEIGELMRIRKPKKLEDTTDNLVFGETDGNRSFCDLLKPSRHEHSVFWDHEEHLPGILIILDKNCMRPMADNPVPENNLKEQGYYASDRQPNTLPDTTYNIIRRFDVPVSDDKGTFMPLYVELRECIFVLSRTCGVPLVWFSCQREFLNGMMCAIAGHFNGLQKDILHCDVSDTNIMFEVESPSVEHVIPNWPKENAKYPKRAGMLSDWGYATDLQRPQELRVGRVTGTFPFMAAQLLTERGRQGEILHEVHHDLESFFWVLWITCVNMNGPFYTRRRWKDEMEDITKEPSPYVSNSRAETYSSPVCRASEQRMPLPITPAFDYPEQDGPSDKVPGDQVSQVMESRVAYGAGGGKHDGSSIVARYQESLIMQPQAESEVKSTIIPRETQYTHTMVNVCHRVPYGEDEGNSPPIWATPGIHRLGVMDVYMWKVAIPKQQFLDSLSPYFRASGSILEGLAELREYFVDDAKRSKITHATFSNILKQMRDGILPEHDRPTDDQMKKARTRYQTLREMGGEHGFAIGVLDDLKIPGSKNHSKRAAEEPTPTSPSKRSRLASQCMQPAWN